MALSPGTRFGPYEIHSPLGAGGMGEVYRARDTKLDREVAIKVLPDLFADDPERRARFEREAKTLAALNHPNIATIHGVEEASGVHALVMELVDGETLAERIAQSPLAVEEALAVARQIAHGLEAAHEHGIVHRDLKPANIKVRPDGAVKILDFGLAKLADSADGRGADLANSPTITSPAMMTGVGVLLGTAAYMAPEQAKGLPADARSDIWAFGCVVFEMLSARPPFTGATVVEVLGGILKADPDWAAVAHVPGGVQAVLRRCLQKDPKQRLRHIADARLQLEDALHEPPPVFIPPPLRQPREPLAWAVAAAAAVAAALAIVAPPLMREGADLPLMRVDIATPPTPDAISLALSRDGRQLAFVAGDDRRLWVRSLDGETAYPLAGTEGATYPFWSPDGQSLGFFANGALKRIDLSGAPPRTLTTVPLVRGGSWGDGVIVFSTGQDQLRRIADAGGSVTDATTLQERHTNHRFPQFLPDGRRFLFYAQGQENAGRGVYVGSLDSADLRFVAPLETTAAYFPSGHLLFVRGISLMAQEFDIESAAVAGDAITLASAVAVNANFGIGAFSASDAGVIAYRAGGNHRQLVWLDSTGRQLAVVGSRDDSNLMDVDLSPDGRHASTTRALQNNRDVWLVDLASSTFRRLTFGAAEDAAPTWSPDGSRIAFMSDRDGSMGLYVKSSTGAGADELLWQSTQRKLIHAWSRDGRFLVFSEGAFGAPDAWDLWVLPMQPDAKPIPFATTPAIERHAEFSPDSRWIAYQSNETGRDEIYVQPFPNTGGKWQISTNGGIEARWSADGRELYYIAPDARLMAVPVQTQDNGFEAGTPMPRFQTRIALGGTVGARPQYDIAADGRILMNVAMETDATTPITLLLNWRPPVR